MGEKFGFAMVMQQFCNLIATVFGLGKSPIAPGTVGSVFAAVMVWFFFPQNPFYQGVWILVSLLLGWVTSACVAANLGQKDPSEVVIDEVAGIFITFFWLPSFSLWVVVFGFLLFRIFDIAKPWLVGKADRLDGASGIMLDDIIAGIFANVILQIGLRLV